MRRDRPQYTALFAVLLVAAVAALGGVAFGQLTDTESNSLQTGTASAITANDSTDGDGNWSQPRANAGRTGVTTGDGPMPYGNVSWSASQTGWTDGPIFVGDTVIAGYAGSDGPPGIVQAYNVSTGNLVWARNDVGAPRGAPTESNGTVYLATYPENGDELPSGVSEGHNGLYALDPETGSTEWYLNESWSAPVVADGTVFVSERPRFELGGPFGNLTAIDAATGKHRWTSDVWGKPLAVADGRVIVGNDTTDTLSAVDASNGSLLWQASVGPEFVVDEHVAATGDGVYVTIGCFSNDEVAGGVEEALVKFSADTGSMEWRRNLSAYMTSPRGGDRIHAPAVTNDTVYVSTSDERYPEDTRHGTVHALDADTGSAQWHFHTKARLGTAPAVANGTVYVVGNYEFNRSRAPDDYPAGDPFHPFGVTQAAYALDAETGTEQWNLTVPTFYADYLPYGLAVDGGRLAFVDLTAGMVPGATISTVEATDERPPWYLHPTGDQNFHPFNYDPAAVVDVEPPAEGEQYAPNVSVTLNGSESSERNGNISTYEWDLDDDGQYETTGETATVQTSSVPCDIIRVTLRVTDDDGETDEETVIIQTEDD